MGRAEREREAAAGGVRCPGASHHGPHGQELSRFVHAPVMVEEAPWRHPAAARRTDDGLARDLHVEERGATPRVDEAGIAGGAAFDLALPESALVLEAGGADRPPEGFPPPDEVVLGVSPEEERGLAVHV